jgi:predicted ATPase
MLYGRDTELARINRLLAQARQGRSHALVLAGEPGVGKSSLLAHALAAADGMHTLHACGVESESELAFATLHQLLRPLLDQLRVAVVLAEESTEMLVSAPARDLPTWPAESR